MDIDIQELESRKEKLLKALKRAEKARDEADSRMQSRYDTQKEDYALEADLIREQIQRLEKEIKQLKSLVKPKNSEFITIGHTVRLQIGDDEPCEVVLVENFGGGSIGEKSTISRKSPIGNAILGRKAGDTVVMKLPDGEVNVHIISTE
jgi:transcription elongation factor GreA